MIKTVKKAIILLLALTMSLVFPGHCFAAEKSPETDIEAIFTERMSKAGVQTAQELVWALSDEVQSGDEWYIVSLRQYYPGRLDFSEYRKAYEEYVQNTEIKNVSTRLKAALTLQAVGSSSAFIDTAADEATGEGGIMSWIYGLHVLTNGAKSSRHTANSVIEELLKLQLRDGGWAVMGDNGDVDVTAMAVQALAPYMGRDIVAVAVDKAIGLLAQRQKDDGNFTSFGDDNPESAAQVLMALCSAGIDCAQDERFIKNGVTITDVLDSYKLSPGKYAHNKGGDANDSAAVQTLYSLIGYKLFLDGQGSFLVFGEFSEPDVPRPEKPVDPDNGGTGPSGDTEPGGNAEPAKNVKPYLYGVVAAAAVIACAALLILKKRSYKSYLFVVLVAALAAVCVRFINIEKPSDYYGKPEDIKDPVKTEIIIDAHTVAGEKSYIPADGIILARTEIVIEKGQTAYDQLVSAVKSNSIHIEITGGSYVAGIGNIYELDFGDLSGWMYRVNGEFASVNCNEYVLSEGDLVEWLYTKNIGKDIGNEYNGGQN